jgi:ribose transport system substrate-binding protein
VVSLRGKWGIGAIGLVILVLGLAVAACGGGGSSSSGGSTESAEGGSTEAAAEETSGGGAAEAASGGGSALVSECESTLEKAGEPLKFEVPGPPIKTSSLKGNSVTFVSLSQAVPTIAEAANQTVAAGKKVGISVSIWDGKGEVTRMQQGIESAVNKGDDAIILLGVPTELVQGALAKAAAANIPVISELNNEPEEGAPGQGAGENIVATTAPSYVEVGSWLACKAIVETEGKANVVIFGAEELQPSAKEVEGIASKLEECEGCTFTENSTPTAEWETKLPGLAESTIRSNPEVNYLLPLYDGMGIFVTAGVRQEGAGDNVKVASFNGTPPGLELVQEGEIFTADPGQSSGWLAFGGLDQAMRAMLGEKPANPKVPLRYFDTENVQGVNVTEEAELYGTEYEGGFEKLWGIGG